MIITLHGGPANGRTYPVEQPPLNFYVMPNGRVAPAGQSGDGRICYTRIGFTNQYECVEVDRAQEVINFSRGIGLKLLPWQETVLRGWFKE